MWLCVYVFHEIKKNIPSTIQKINCDVPHCWWSVWSSDGCKCYLFNALVGAIFLLYLFYKMFFRRHQVQLNYSSCPLHFQHLKSSESFPHQYLQSSTFVSWHWHLYLKLISSVVLMYQWEYKTSKGLGFFQLWRFLLVVFFWLIVVCLFVFVWGFFE